MKNDDPNLWKILNIIEHMLGFEDRQKRPFQCKSCCAKLSLLTISLFNFGNKWIWIKFISQIKSNIVQYKNLSGCKQFEDEKYREAIDAECKTTNEVF